MLGVFGWRAADQVLQQQQVPRTPLNDRKQPIPKLKITASRICFLFCDESGKIWLACEQSRIRSQGGVKGSDEGAVQGEVWKMGEQN
jgi:hypothetical protein